MTDRELAIEVVQRLRAAGFQALWAGGCVRDQLLGIEPHDYDVATDARPERVQALFRRTIAVGASFGVIEVLGPKPLRVQVATFRSDGEYDDGRRPVSVTYSSPEDDARRRDFTINGMFFDPIGGRVIDYVGGEADLRAGVIRAIGDPVSRFTEDKLRLLRAVRFAARFGFALDSATADAIRSMAGQIAVVSAERVADELRRLLTDSGRAVGVRLLSDVGLSRAILPEVGDRLDGRVLARLDEPVTFTLGLAAWLDEAPPSDLAAIAARLRLSNAERSRIEWLAAMRNVLNDAPRMAKSRLKPILAHSGISELLSLHRARAGGSEDANAAFCEQRLRDWPPAVLSPPPLLTGDDLVVLGMSPGPAFRTILERVRDAQLDDAIETPEQARALALQIAARR